MTAPLIAVFCSSFPPEGGGAAARMYNLAVLLRNAGYRVQVTCAMPNYPTGKITPPYRGKKVVDELIDGIAVKRVWLIPSNAASPLKRAVSAASLVWGFRRYAFTNILDMRPALVIVSSPPLPMAAAVVRFFTMRGVKVLLNISDIWPLSAGRLGALHEKGMLYKALRRMETAMYRNATAFTAQSDESISHLRKSEGGEKPVMCYRNLPAGLPREAFPVPPADTIRIIYPGMLGHAQGVLAHCKAIPFAGLNAVLHIYGDGPERQAVEAWTELNKGSGVCYFPAISGRELSALLPRYHAMLVPLAAPLEGAVPSKIFTAVWAGIPVICSAGGEAARIVEEYGLGWNVPPLDYDGIATLIRSLGRYSHEERSARQAHILRAGKTVFDKEIQDQSFLQFLAALL